jgi:hypothetical protein
MLSRKVPGLVVQHSKPHLADSVHLKGYPSGHLRSRVLSYQAGLFMLQDMAVKHQGRMRVASRSKAECLKTQGARSHRTLSDGEYVDNVVQALESDQDVVED